MEDGQDPVGERNLNFCAQLAKVLKKLLLHVFANHVLLGVTSLY